MFRPTIRSLLRGVPLLVATGALMAQTPAVDPSARLREVLPADVAERVIARIAAARARELPAQALENRALKFASRGIVPAEVERAVGEHAVRLERAQAALRVGRPATTPVEVEAGAEALRQGASGAAVSELARSTPSGRSLAVPLFVLGSLVERGLPSDEALARVRDRLQERASDADLERLPLDAARRGEGAPGRGRAGAAGRPAGTPAGPPAGVPANGGRPTQPGNRPPVTPPRTPPVVPPTGA